MELNDSELYWTRKQKGLATEKETEEYIKKLERKTNNLEQIESEHQKENGKLRIQASKLEKKNIRHFIYKNLTLYIIMVLVILFLLMNIKIRNDKIWQQGVEIEDLKEQLDKERIKR